MSGCRVAFLDSGDSGDGSCRDGICSSFSVLLRSLMHESCRIKDKKDNGNY